jgi:hypothetical protein
MEVTTAGEVNGILQMAVVEIVNFVSVRASVE